jgi:cytochrome oxidase Cu insertion factor (SCO1/SenC/PrrC family)
MPTSRTKRRRSKNANVRLFYTCLRRITLTVSTHLGQETAAQKVGRPKIGGPFKLTTQYGTEFTEQDLLGKFSLVYVSPYNSRIVPVLIAVVA